MEKNKSKNNINEDIKAREVMLINDDGTNQGVIKTQDALTQAKSVGLDLVEMSSSAKQTVCRIMDYGKFIFEANKRKKQNSKESKTKNDIKEIRLRPAIGDNDLKIKAKQARKFLESGKKVKLDIRMRGRERRHPELAKEVVYRFVEEIKDVCVLEEKGNSFVLVTK